MNDKGAAAREGLSCKSPGSLVGGVMEGSWLGPKEVGRQLIEPGLEGHGRGTWTC